MRAASSRLRWAAVAIAAWVVCLATSAGTARADTLAEIFRKANEAYFHADFEHAAAGYERLVDAGILDPDVTFNLATTYGRMGKYGRSILWFERTLRLEPGDEAAEAGLTAARAALGRRRAEAEGEATVQVQRPFIDALVAPIAENALAIFVLLLDFIVFGALIARRWAQGEALRLGLGIVAPLAALALLLCALGLVAKTEVFRDGEAAIVVDDARLSEGPDPRAQQRGRALEGESARILAREGTFVQVRLDGRREGWLPASAVGRI